MFMLTGYGSPLKDDTAHNEFKDIIGNMIRSIDPNDTTTEQVITDNGMVLTRKVHVLRVGSDLIHDVNDRFKASGWSVAERTIDFEPALYYKRKFDDGDYGVNE
jgi:hypothetical protein